jgi:ParB family chromosome partitioning protein
MASKAIPKGTKVIDLPISKIKLDLEQPRGSMARESLEDLTESVRDKGVLQPIVVRQKKGEYQLIIGGRRLEAARRAGNKTIPAVIKEASDPEAYELALIENIQRDNLSVFEEAQALFHLMRSEKFETPNALAKRIGKRPAFVSDRLRILQLPSNVKELIAKKELGVAQAVSISRVTDPKRQENLARIAVDGALTSDETEALVTKRVVTLNRRLKVGDTLSPLKILQRFSTFLSVLQSSEWPAMGEEVQGRFIELMDVLSHDFSSIAKSLRGEQGEKPILGQLESITEKLGRAHLVLTLLYSIEETERLLDHSSLSSLLSRDRARVKDAMQRLSKTIARHGLPPAQDRNKGKKYEVRTPVHVIEAVAGFYDVTVEGLKGDSRDNNLVKPRHVAIYLLSKDLGLSQSAIGNEFGNRDHSTITHAVVKVDDELKKSGKLRAEVALLRKQLFSQPPDNLKSGKRQRRRRR